MQLLFIHIENGINGCYVYDSLTHETVFVPAEHINYEKIWTRLLREKLRKLKTIHDMREDGYNV